MASEYKLAPNFPQSLKGAINWFGLEEIMSSTEDAAGKDAFCILDWGQGV